LKYQDVSTGAMVCEHRTKLGAPTSMTQNPYNAIIHLGHSNGTVTLWSPNMSTPLVKMLTHHGPVRSLAVDREGRFMVTAGADYRVKIWDIRNYREIHSYYTQRPTDQVRISELGLLGIGWGGHVSVPYSYDDKD
jgi:U3 small nucleolar RNA-associated protein 7